MLSKDGLWEFVFEISYIFTLTFPFHKNSYAHFISTQNRLPSDAALKAHKKADINYELLF
jgi:hypothetical protein